MTLTPLHLNPRPLSVPRADDGKWYSDGRLEAGGGTTDPGDLPEPNLFFDDFSDGEMDNGSLRQVDLNECGFQWESNNKTSLFRLENNDEDARVVWNNGTRDNLFEGAGPAGTGEFDIRSGGHALRFRYDNSSGPEQIWSEQRFSMQGENFQELWARWWVRVPFNYKHGFNPDGIQNNKFFNFRPSTDGSTGADGPTLTIELVNDGSTEAGDGSRLRIVGFVNTNGFQHDVFIRVPEDRGRWMQCVAHMKVESAEGAGDGEKHLWRRWEDEESFTYWGGGSTSDYEDGIGIKSGYMMGMATYLQEPDDPGADAAQHFIVDDLELSSEPLVPAGTEQEL